MNKKDSAQEPDVIIYVDEQGNKKVEMNLKNSGSVASPISKETLDRVGKMLKRDIDSTKNKQGYVFNSEEPKIISESSFQIKGGTDISKIIENFNKPKSNSKTKKPKK